MIGPAMPTAGTAGAAGSAAAKAAMGAGKNEVRTHNGKVQKGQCVRRAAGKVWYDESLDEWPQDDFRIFCGDLGNEVTDDLLANAFRKFPSFQKAKVIRDRRSQKTRGFGFVSFGNPEDMVRALKEVDEKYVGNRPIKLRKSTWKERAVDSDKNKHSPWHSSAATSAILTMEVKQTSTPWQTVKKFKFAINSESKTQTKFKKIKKKQDPEKQKALQRLRNQTDIDPSQVVMGAKSMKKMGGMAIADIRAVLLQTENVSERTVDRFGSQNAEDDSDLMAAIQLSIEDLNNNDGNVDYSDQGSLGMSQSTIAGSQDARSEVTFSSDLSMTSEKNVPRPCTGSEKSSSSSLYEKKIELVASQVPCSLSVAKKALEFCHNDVVEAIMILQTNPQAIDASQESDAVKRSNKTSKINQKSNKKKNSDLDPVRSRFSFSSESSVEVSSVPSSQLELVEPKDVTLSIQEQLSEISSPSDFTRDWISDGDLDSESDEHGNPVSSSNRNLEDWQLLIIASETNNLKEVEALLENDDIDINRAREDDSTALWTACQHNHHEIYLLEHPDIDVGKRAAFLFTPIFMAKGQGHENIVQLIKDHQATKRKNDKCSVM
eukprot:gene853-316_t